MGLFGKKKNVEKQIKSVVILEQTNLYSNRVKHGYSFGSEWGDGRVIGMSETVPNGTEYTFSVTYIDGSREIVKALSGTSTCDKLLQYAVEGSEPDSTAEGSSSLQEEALFSLGKNQLPQGIYIVGKDIPAGIYDFTWVWGNGSFMKFKDSSTTLGASTDFQHVGNKESYEVKQVINVDCKDGEYIHISGNVVVSIAKSKAVQIEL